VRDCGETKNLEMLTTPKELLKCASSVRFVLSATLKKAAQAGDDRYLHGPVILHLPNVRRWSMRRIPTKISNKVNDISRDACWSPDSELIVPTSDRRRFVWVASVSLAVTCSNNLQYYTDPLVACDNTTCVIVKSE
jgi:hypothetical protein